MESPHDAHPPRIMNTITLAARPVKGVLFSLDRVSEMVAHSPIIVAFAPAVLVPRRSLPTVYVPRLSPIETRTSGESPGEENKA